MERRRCTLLSGNATIHGRRIGTINGRRVNWVVHREVFAQPTSNIDWQIPDAVVVRSMLAGPNTQESQHQRFDRYNWLIVEVEPPNQDTPQRWKDLLLQACSRIY